MASEIWNDGARAVLRDARTLVERPDNDYSWSSWRDGREALQEIDRLIERLETGTAHPSQVAALFAPTGPLQELGESSGLGRAVPGPCGTMRPGLGRRRGGGAGGGYVR